MTHITVDQAFNLPSLNFKTPQELYFALQDFLGDKTSSKEKGLIIPDHIEKRWMKEDQEALKNEKRYIDVDEMFDDILGEGWKS